MTKKLFICTILIFSMSFFASSEKCSQQLTLSAKPATCKASATTKKTTPEVAGNDVATLLPRFIIIE